MSQGDKKDWELFNCSEQHEIDYVKELFLEEDDVEAWIKNECKTDGKINNTKHAELYEMLRDAGFNKIK